MRVNSLNSCSLFSFVFSRGNCKQSSYHSSRVSCWFQVWNAEWRKLPKKSSDFAKIFCSFCSYAQSAYSNDLCYTSCILEYYTGFKEWKITFGIILLLAIDWLQFSPSQVFARINWVEIFFALAPYHVCVACIKFVVLSTSHFWELPVLAPCLRSSRSALHLCHATSTWSSVRPGWRFATNLNRDIGQIYN